MQLYVIIARGNYALSVDVVRSTSPASALKLVHPGDCATFHTFEVKELVPSGTEQEVIVGANYIE